MYDWIDIEKAVDDARFVSSARDTLKQEREAWEACHAERQRLHARIRELEDIVRQTYASLRRKGLL